MDGFRNIIELLASLRDITDFSAGFRNFSVCLRDISISLRDFRAGFRVITMVDYSIGVKIDSPLLKSDVLGVTEVDPNRRLKPISSSSSSLESAGNGAIGMPSFRINLHSEHPGLLQGRQC